MTGFDACDLIGWLAERRALDSWRRQRAQWLLDRGGYRSWRSATAAAEAELVRMSPAELREIVLVARMMLEARVRSAEARLARAGVRA